jgi:hypothetical protein
LQTSILPGGSAFSSEMLEKIAKAQKFVAPSTGQNKLMFYCPSHSGRANGFNNFSELLHPRRHNSWHLSTVRI